MTHIDNQPPLWAEHYLSLFLAVPRSIAKTGVNIKPILLRLKDRENAENDRNFDRKSINFPLFEMEFLRNWFGNPAQAR